MQQVAEVTQCQDPDTADAAGDTALHAAALFGAERRLESYAAIWPTDILAASRTLT